MRLYFLEFSRIIQIIHLSLHFWICKWWLVWTHDFLSNFAQRVRQPVVLELSSFVPSRAYFEFWCLEKRFLACQNLLVVALVLVEIQRIRDGRSSNYSRWTEACCWNSLTLSIWDSTLCFCFTNSHLAWVSKWSLIQSRRDFQTCIEFKNLKNRSHLKHQQVAFSLSLRTCVLIQPVQVPLCLWEKLTLAWPRH